MKRIVITLLLTSSALAFSQSNVSAPIVVSKPATYVDIVSLWASGACSGFLKSDGTCGDAGGSGGGGGGISGLTTGYIPLAGSATTLTSNSHLNDGVTTASVITSSEQVTAPAYTTNGSTPGNVSLAPGSGNITPLPTGSGGFAAPASGGTAYLFKLPATVTAGVLHAAAPTSGDGVNESVITTGPINLATDVVGVLPAANGGSSSATPNVQVTLPTSAISANSCTAPATVAMTGLTTSSTFTTAFASNPNSVTGWGATGGLTFTAWPTENTLNWSICNQTSAAITPGPMKLNVGAP